MRLFLSLFISHGRTTRKMGLGLASRTDMLRNLLTALVRHERILTTTGRADELRPYAEKIIDYGKLGDRNARAMKIADFWLTEKDLIPKLFRVLAPRFAESSGPYLQVVRVPNSANLDRAPTSAIEYLGNPLPPLPIKRRAPDDTLLNTLIRGLREEMQDKIKLQPKAMEPNPKLESGPASRSDSSLNCEPVSSSEAPAVPLNPHSS
uniref:large ribosomal subunit protein bL17m-like isoform X6 n=1 Tax=Myxine glutinosa TaxID=7769 RepID=UPI00358E190C